MKATVPIILSESLRRRFWSNIEQESTGCWLWQGGTNTNGYGTLCGQTNTERYSYLAHRVAWTIVFGDIEPGMLVCHTCDNPPCCNPMHFFLGDDKANSDDREAKGRTPWYIAQMSAKTHCPKGHPYSGENLAQYEHARVCRTCKLEQGRASGKRYKARLVHAAVTGTYIQPTDEDRAIAEAYTEAIDLDVPYGKHIAERLNMKASQVQHAVLHARASGLVPLGRRMKLPV